MTIKQHGGVFGRNPTFNNVDIEGTLTVNGEPISDFGTMAQQDADAVNIDGGAIDGVTLGTNSPVTDARIDNVRIDGNTISTTDTNGNVIIDPNGSGTLDLRANIAMPKEVNREFSIAQSDASDSGANLTIKAGNGGTGGASVDGGDLLLYAGDTWSGDSNFLGGDVKIYSGGNVVQDGQHGSIYFYVKGTTHTTEAARFKSTGNLAFPSGQGIDFSATAGTGTSELLDDYEEGTWTPTILFDGANVGMTFNIQAGNYTKVGNLVTASCYLNLANKGSSTGSAFVGGLPFTSGNVANQNSPSTLWVSAVSFADFLQGFNGVNTSTISLREATNAGVQSSLSEANFANNSSVMVSVSYRV